jgi:hypothetical protein
LLVSRFGSICRSHWRRLSQDWRLGSIPYFKFFCFFFRMRDIGDLMRPQNETQTRTKTNGR